MINPYTLANHQWNSELNSPREGQGPRDEQLKGANQDRYSPNFIWSWNASQMRPAFLTMPHFAWRRGSPRYNCNPSTEQTESHLTIGFTRDNNGSSGIHAIIPRENKLGFSKMSERLWLTWETQRRNRTLSRLVNAKLYEFDIHLPGILRYPAAIWKTLNCLAAENPTVIFAQNPSIVLAYIAVLYANIRGKKVVIDAHNAGLFPAEGRYRLLNWFAAKLPSWSTLTIVTNDDLKSHVEGMGGNAISIPDPIPAIEIPEKAAELKGDFNILFICSWAQDEPYSEVLNAAAQLDPGICIYITGNSKRKENLSDRSLPENIVLTGYVTDKRFNQLLHGSDAVMVLTTRDNCLLCGAYEGVSTEKPLLLSDTKVLRSYFSEGAVYTDNNASSIADAIRVIRNQHTRLEKEVRKLKAIRSSEFPELLSSLESQLQVPHVRVEAPNIEEPDNGKQ